MENIIKTMVNTTVPGMIALNMNNLAELVPEDERAVDEVEFCPMVGSVHDILKASIPEDEQAVDDGEQEDELSTAIAQAEERGCFSAANGMAQITNVLDGRLYAAIYVDAKGKQNIAFCERYDNGKFSPKMQISKGELRLLGSCNMDPKLISVSKLKKIATDVITQLTMDYFNKFSGGRAPMNLTDILQALAMVLNNLPVYRDVTEEELAMQFYREVVHCLETTGMLKINKWIYNHRAYYALDDESLEILAEAMKMKSDELEKKLKQYSLLYRTGKAAGYKTRVRINRAEGESEEYIKKWNITGPSLEWCYCIYKVQNLGK